VPLVSDIQTTGLLYQLTSGGRSVGIVSLRAKDHGVYFSECHLQVAQRYSTPSNSRTTEHTNRTLQNYEMSANFMNEELRDIGTGFLG
jgi:hypothetical protein